MKKTLRVLHVEDKERDMALLTRHLTRAGYDLISERVETYTAMKAALTEREWDVILCDYSMPQFSALSAMALLKEMKLDIPFIIISGTVGETLAVEVMKAGASDYLMKDNLARLAPTIERELREAENRRARRRAEEQVRLQATALQAAANAIVITDNQGTINWVNPAFTTLTGYAREQVLGRSIRILKSSKHDTQFYKVLWDTVLSGQVWHGEMINRRKDGSFYFEEQTITPVMNETGEIINFIAIKQDVTEQKRAEAELRRSEAQYRRLLETTFEGVWVFDAELRTSYVNQRLTQMLGVNEEEMIGRSALDFVSEDSRADVQQGLERRRRGIKEQYDVHLRRKDGSDLWAIVCATPILGEDGAFMGSLSMLTDITERKRIEQELRKSEERYRDLVENAHDIIYSHDLEGNYTSINKAGELITGYTREEVLRMNLAQTVAPEYQEKARQMIASKLAGEKTTAYEMEIMAKDGRRVPVEVTTKLIFQDNFAVGVQGIARDVTERRTLEDQLRQAQKMEAVGQLAGGVAHDFNNLITAITGYSDLALRRLKAEDPLRHNIEEIKKAGDRAAALTRQLLAFSRKQVLQPVSLNLNSVVSDLEKMLRRLIGEDVELRTALEPELGSTKADPGQVEQIILNLVVNARDAMPLGGKLTIETENVYLDKKYASEHIAITPGHYVMLAVSDTGTGMDEKTRARIFEPFFTTKELGKGTGLGLSTVYGIVKQSGGNIWVYSEVERGTTFKIYLPRIDEGADEYRRYVEVEGDLQGTETILLAEDEEVVRNLAVQVLEEYGYRVLDAANGGAALLICEREKSQIHLLVTDVIMPEMNGHDLAERLKQLRPEMKVLFMSGYTDNAIAQQGMLDKGANFIEKPFSPQTLAKKVREVLDEKQNTESRIQESE